MTEQVLTQNVPIKPSPQELDDVKALQDTVLLTTLEKLVNLSHIDVAINWSRKSSVWPLTFGLACCAIEMMAVGAAKYDLDRFGSGPFRATPRQADLMVVAGTVTHKMAPRVKRLFDQMPEPKYVIAMGACTINGGPYFEFGYHVVQGVDLIIPVDIYMPGCPPRPEAFLEALFRIQELIKREKVLDRDRSRVRPKIYDGAPIFHGVGELTEDEKQRLAQPEKRQEMMTAFNQHKPQKYKMIRENVTCAAWIVEKKKAEAALPTVSTENKVTPPAENKKATDATGDEEKKKMS